MGLKEGSAGESGVDKPALLGCQSWEYFRGAHAQAQAEVGMEANTGRRTQHHCEFGESGADPTPRCFDAREDPHQNVCALVLVRLFQTCHYQRKDSPVEALTLSPEPLGGIKGGHDQAKERKEEQKGGKMGEENERKSVNKKEKKKLSKAFFVLA